MAVGMTSTTLVTALTIRDGRCSGGIATLSEGCGREVCTPPAGRTTTRTIAADAGVRSASLSAVAGAVPPVVESIAGLAGATPRPRA
jgi:hypothetical protein